MVGLAIVPQPGANYVQIAKDFYERLEQIKKDLPPDITVKVALDNTRFISNSITEVKETLANIVYTGGNYYLPFLQGLAYCFPPVDRYTGIIDRGILYHVCFWVFY
jgi:multidrug efflux pump subunit AcrB